MSSKLTDLSQLGSLFSPDEKEKLAKEEATLASKKTLGNGAEIRVFIDKVRRRGKSVTVASEFQHNPQVIEKLATDLKQFCGAGGTVKGREIEIQGDHREKVAQKLRALGFVVRV